MRYSICLLIYFFQLFSLHFIFLPVRIRTVFAVVGIFVIYRNKKFIKIPKIYYLKWRFLWILLFFLFIITLVSSVINSNFDSFFYRYPISIIMSFSSAYIYLMLIDKCYKKEIDAFFIKKLLVGACLMQCLISLLMFIMPGLKDVLLSVLSMTELGAQSMESNVDNVRRLVSLGGGFFSCGTLLALGALLCATLLVRSKKIEAIRHFVVLVMILVIGSMIARTTLVGLFIAFAYVILETHSSIKHKLFIFLLVLLLSFLVITIYFVYLEGDPVFGLAFERGFSLFYDYQQTGEFTGLESYATNDIYPKTIKTWIIGDGLMSDPKDPDTSYYMGVDKGFLRLLFSLGLSGLFFYSLVQFSLCMLSSLTVLEVLLMFAAYAMFMFKGIFSFDIILAPLIMMPIYLSIQRNKSNKYVKKNAEH